MTTNLLIFFAIPLAIIIISIALQKVLRNPILVSGIVFSVLLVIVLAFFDPIYIIAAVVYAILAFITAIITSSICNYIKNQICNNNLNDNLNIDLNSSLNSSLNGNLAENNNNSCSYYNNLNTNNIADLDGNTSYPGIPRGYSQKFYRRR